MMRISHSKNQALETIKLFQSFDSVCSFPWVDTHGYSYLIPSGLEETLRLIGNLSFFASFFIKEKRRSLDKSTHYNLYRTKNYSRLYNLLTADSL